MIATVAVGLGLVAGVGLGAVLAVTRPDRASDFGVTNRCGADIEVRAGGSEWQLLADGRSELGPLPSGMEVRVRTPGEGEGRVMNQFLGLRVYGDVVVSGDRCP